LYGSKWFLRLLFKYSFAELHRKVLLTAGRLLLDGAVVGAILS
jgi:hypothetical protein